MAYPCPTCGQPSPYGGVCQPCRDRTKLLDIQRQQLKLQQKAAKEQKRALAEARNQTNQPQYQPRYYSEPENYEPTSNDESDSIGMIGWFFIISFFAVIIYAFMFVFALMVLAYHWIIASWVHMVCTAVVLFIVFNIFKNKKPQ